MLGFLRKNYIFLIFVGLILFNFYLFGFYIRHQDLNFFTDVARDFLLFEEIDLKKIILIGPRSSTAGIFHGPLWLYLNYPAYLLSNGNPLGVSYFWIIISVLFVISSVLLAKKYFGVNTAVIFGFLLSSGMFFQLRSLFNPHGALFLIPAFYFTLYEYWREGKFWAVLAHLFVIGLIIQFQMAIGIPLLILSAPLLLYKMFTNRHHYHILSFALLPLLLSNFIFFEIRHGYNMLRSIMDYASPVKSWGEVYNYWQLIDNRIEKLVDLQLVPLLPAHITGIIFAIFVFCTHLLYRTEAKLRQAIILLCYLFLGYIFLTFVNKGVVLEHQYYPIMPLTALAFALLIKTINTSKIFSLGLIIILIYNFKSQYSITTEFVKKFTVKNENSWRGLEVVAQKIIQTEPTKDFGYFVYSPDAFAYQPRYAMKYFFKTAGLKPIEYSKQPITYVISAPAPKDKPEIGYMWWRTDRLNIKASPSAVFKFPNGYMIEKFNLTNEEQSIPYEPTINVGIHFR